MTNFFEQQKKSRARSKRIITVFIILLCAQFFAFYYIFKEGLTSFDYLEKSIDYIASESNGYSYHDKKNIKEYKANIVRRSKEQGLIFSVIISIFFIVLFTYKRYSLLSRPHQIPSDMEAKEVTSYTSDAKEKMYYNIVSEMAMASGVPLPKVYLLTKERSLNAFTSGHDFKTAAITITEGALREFTRDELQAVVAHEFGHIVSEDVKSSINLLSVVFSLSVLYAIGWRFMRILSRSKSSSNSKGRVKGLLIAVAILILSYIGFLLSRLVVALFSREREYLADALSVQFTRYPSALASALAKIRDHHEGSELEDSKAQEIASICFSSPFSSFASLFASHPPINSRITRIDKRFLEKGLSSKKLEKQNFKKINTEKKPNATKSMQYIMGLGVIAEQNKKIAEKTKQFFDKSDLDPYLTPHKVESLIYALILSPNNEIRKKQEILIFDNTESDTLKNTKIIYEKIKSGNIVKSLSLLDIMVPFLMEFSVFKNDKVTDLTRKIIDVEGKKVGFEQFIYCFIKRYLLGPSIDSKNPKRTDIEFLLDSITNLNIQPDMESKRKALEHYYGKNLSEKKSDASAADLEIVLDRIGRLSSKKKQKLIEAILIAINFDDVVTREEFESFRVVCDFLEVPAPPIEIND